MILPKTLKCIAFDADDTLWINEPIFRQIETEFATLMSSYAVENHTIKAFFDMHVSNLKYYGYGIKSFILSMMESALILSNNRLNATEMQTIIALGHKMLNYPVVLLEGIEETLSYLSKKYRLVVATKGDLFDQERKLKASNLEKYFHHIEIMSEKNISTYQKLMDHLEVNATDFLMIGNALKSDILPVLALGAYAIHIPFETTWAHEEVLDPIDNKRFIKITHHTELITIL